MSADGFASMAPALGGPPPRPAPWEERAASWLFYLVSPRLGKVAAPVPPDGLAPWEPICIPRPERGGTLAGTLYPAAPARAAALLVHPWMDAGQAYFHRRGRVEALRAAGIHVLTFDQSGFHGSASRRGFPDRDVADALAHLGTFFPGLPLLLWGVSAGGYWSHFVLSRQTLCRAAAFEDVAQHLLRWAWRQAPAGRPCYAVFRTLLPRAWRYLDLRRHAPHLRVRSASYASGRRDRGVRPEETAELARLAGASHLLVDGAGHLASIKLAGAEVVDLALQSFARGLAAG